AFSMSRLEGSRWRLRWAREMPLAMEFEWGFFRPLFGAKRACGHFQECGGERQIPPHAWRIISRAASAAPAASCLPGIRPEPIRFQAGCARLFFIGKGWTSVCAILLASRLTGGWFMANPKASPNLETLPTSPPLVQTLPSDAVLDALKMILLGAPLNEVLTTITRLIEAHSTGILCSI